MIFTTKEKVEVIHAGKVKEYLTDVAVINNKNVKLLDIESLPVKPDIYNLELSKDLNYHVFIGADVLPYFQEKRRTCYGDKYTYYSVFGFEKHYKEYQDIMALELSWSITVERLEKLGIDRELLSLFLAMSDSDINDVVLNDPPLLI